ncbi:MAG: hypothetical protein PHU71_06300, partial [Candidatus Gracilibacteria bacterium]|nr:hypothetical protein [Candidatus Gracilibacteria bacterium]
SVTKWWNQRYRQMISVNEAAEMIGGKTRVLTVNGVRLSYRPVSEEMKPLDYESAKGYYNAALNILGRGLASVGSIPRSSPL